jgi:hypothetical protein
VQWHKVVGQMSELSILDPLLWTSPSLAYEALTALNFHAFFQWCSNEDGVANVDERFWQELADTHAAFYNHNNAVDLSK